MAAKVTKDMIIADIISIDRGLVPILMEAGMHCVGCPSSQEKLRRSRYGSWN